MVRGQNRDRRLCVLGDRSSDDSGPSCCGSRARHSVIVRGDFAVLGGFLLVVLGVSLCHQSRGTVAATAPLLLLLAKAMPSAVERALLRQGHGAHAAGAHALRSQEAAGQRAVRTALRAHQRAALTAVCESHSNASESTNPE